MSSKKNKGLVVFIIIAILTIGYGVLELLQPQFFETYSPIAINSNHDSQNNFSFKSSKTAYIAKLDIKGTIQSANMTYNQEWLLKTISGLKEDPANKGIILFIDSPGGTVYEADEAYLALLDYRQSGKPVFAYFGSIATSGAYYIGCAADRIYANRNSITGSIGIISGTSVDLTGLMDNLGIKSKTIHAGKNKNIGNYNEPLTAEQEKILQDMADESYNQFVEIVANSRYKSITDVEKLADGRVYTAKQAVENGLVDKISTFDECYNDFVKNRLFGTEYSLVYFSYEKPRNFTDYLFQAFNKFSNEAVTVNTAPFYYLAK